MIDLLKAKQPSDNTHQTNKSHSQNAGRQSNVIQSQYGVKGAAGSVLFGSQSGNIKLKDNTNQQAQLGIVNLIGGSHLTSHRATPGNDFRGSNFKS